ncbi:hypothetical protein [Crocinitomix algicola]|uniref:hypothetical protein n=1 Tax=Crocinitomix algicola TaxID=1740263 RepID=UPI0008734B7A|nr:hypothetical protein [Crocinitomix algicola]
MDFFNTLDKVKYYIGRFMWPVLFLIVGLFLLKMAVVPEVQELNSSKLSESGEVVKDTVELTQNSGFLYASLFFLAAAVVWFLYLFDIAKSFVGYLIMAAMVVCSAVVIYMDYTNIQETVEFNAAVEIRDIDIKARMDDIKEAELAYKEFHGHYTNSFDVLIDFVKNGKKMKIYKRGSIPERKITPEERDFIYGDNRPIDNLMTEVEATLLANSENPPADLEGFKRDTNYVKVLDAVFRDSTRIDNRAKTGASLQFHPDSLRFVPHTKNLVTLDTASTIVNEVVIPTIYIEMLHPLNKQLGEDSIVYSIGDLNSNTTRESWKD